MSFYTSLNGIKNAQTSLNVVSNNIANAETNGFKKSTVTFADVVAGTAFTNPRLIEGIGAKVEAITQNFTQGPMESTGSSLDLAVSGDGFFTSVSPTTGQTVYSRNGAFELDPGGYIVDPSGNRVQLFPTDAAGNVTGTTMIDGLVPTTNSAGSAFAGLTVNENGNVAVSYADGSNMVIGKVGLATFLNPTGLRQQGSSNWTATGLSGAASYGQPTNGQYGKLLSGYRERSNVEISEELVGLIVAQRDYQANAKAIDTATQATQAVLNLRS